MITFKPRSCALMLAAVLAPAHVALAHVALDSPNGGEQYVTGSQVTLRWHILIAHNLQNWDLWYSHTGNTGPWTVLAQNVPAGSGAVGSVHTYNWTVPDAVDTTVWVRVRMDNSATDYFDVSASPFAIVPYGDTNGDGVVNVDDLIRVILDWGSDGSALGGDINGDGIVDVDDIIDVILNWSSTK